MKKLTHILIGFLLAIGFTSCDGNDPLSQGFDETLLYGKWQEGSVYERYYASPIDFVLSNGDTVQVNGTTWDVGDDISEDEAQAFNWTLNNTTLTQEHISTFVTVPKVYTVTALTSSTLTYTDDYGTTHHFNKAD